MVIVTVVDEDNYSTQYIKNIKENRIEYARKHGKKHLGGWKRKGYANHMQVTLPSSPLSRTTISKDLQFHGPESQQSDTH